MKENGTIGYKDFLSNANLKVYGTWDDHDYGGNDSGNSMPNRKERQDVFWEFLGYQPHSHDGVYHSVDIENGKVKLILLDTRWFRDDHCIPSLASKIPLGNAIACVTRWLTAGLYLHKLARLWGMSNCRDKQFLGEEQWKWLEETLLLARSSDKTEAIIIVSSVQVFTTNPSMESWGHFPKEQERLWNLLKHHYSSGPDEGKTAAPVFFLSGDVHHGEISGQQGYMEITSSGLTHHCGQPKIYGGMCKPLLETFYKHRHSQDEYFVGLNYGLIDFDFDARTIAFQIKNNVGSTVLSYTQSLDSRIVGLGPYNDLPHTWNGHLIPLFIFVLLCLTVGVVYLQTIMRKRGERRKPKDE
jgi:alkaline phosphatase D